MTISEKLQTIAKNTQKVYEAGEEAEYDRFWDNYQNYGNRTNYQYAFCGIGWKDETFKPKYDLKFSDSATGQNVFQYCKIANLKKCMEEHNVKFDFYLATTSTSVTRMFSNASELTDVPELDLSCVTSLHNFFYNCKKLKNVDKMIISEECTNINFTFANCESLENITFDGTIVANINLASSTLLTKASLMSLINCLSNNIGTGLTRTATLGTANLAKLEDAEKAIATEKGWNLA